MLEKAGQIPQDDTPTDPLEEGTDYEESGDRWHSLDLPKALRFYQKAYGSYREAAQSQNLEIAADALYNALRLLFHVYLSFTKGEGLDLQEMEIQPGISETSVVQGIQFIVHFHQMALQTGTPSRDLQFNAALVMTEAIEASSGGEGENSDWTTAAELFSAASGLLGPLFSLQMQEIQRLVQEPPQETASASADENSTLVAVHDTLDTATVAFVLSLTLLESVTDADFTQAEIMATEFLRGVLPLAEELVAAISRGEISNVFSTNNGHDIQPAIVDFHVAVTLFQALASNNVHSVREIWQNENLPDLAPVHMAALDSMESVLTRLNLNIGPSDLLEYWDGLNHMATHLSRAHQILNEQYQVLKKKLDPGPGTGDLIAQLGKLYMARADVSLQQARLALPAAEKSRDVLLKNCRTFLTNAEIVAQAKGGIREKVTERAKRQSVLAEVRARKAVLDGLNFSQAENTIAGLWYYQS